MGLIDANESRIELLRTIEVIRILTLALDKAEVLLTRNGFSDPNYAVAVHG